MGSLSYTLCFVHWVPKYLLRKCLKKSYRNYIFQYISLLVCEINFVNVAVLMTQLNNNMKLLWAYSKNYTHLFVNTSFYMQNFHSLVLSSAVLYPRVGDTIAVDLRFFLCSVPHLDWSCHYVTNYHYIIRGLLFLLFQASVPCMISSKQLLCFSNHVPKVS